MTTTYNAIDLSYDPLDAAALVARPELELVIQNLWDGVQTPPAAESNLRLALAFRRRIAGYVVANPAVAVGRGLDFPGDLLDALDFIAVDCEFYPDLTPARVRAELDAVSLRLPWRTPVLYTSRGYWRSTLGDDASFGDVYLWDARYNSPATEAGAAVPFVPYGAWQSEDRLIGVQRTATCKLGATGVDYSQISLEVLDMVSAAEQQQSHALQMHDVRMKLAGAALNNDMQYLVTLLVVAGVLPAGTAALKPVLS